ncbi:MAG: hypothetical protein WBA93_28665 [Microcoleaceae cyanobacterium]
MDEVNFNIWGNDSINISGEINSDAPTYAIIHGWRNTGGNSDNNYNPSDWMADQAQTIRGRESNANIILVDWEDGANKLWYFSSASITEDVGNELATYLSNNNLDPNYTNLIGHSLGAHVAGFAGSTYLESTGDSISQIVGLDPAGPAFEGKDAGDRLDPNDANRVVTFHTSKTLGYDDPLAVLDVYVNSNSWFQPGQWNVSGNHGYATTLFTELLEGNSFTQSNSSLFNLNTVVNAEFTGVNNTTTKNNKDIIALDLSGTFSDDNLAGGADNDSISGNGGNDYITGGDGNDSLFGNGGNDILYGGGDNDFVFGGIGSDRLFGDEGDDLLTGTNAVVKGDGEIDSLTGGGGSDRFVLGTTQGEFYSDDDPNTSGISDYLLITDFNTLDDTLQLSGSESEYSLEDSPIEIVVGTAIFLNESLPELIAIVAGDASLSLSSSYFEYV